MSPGRRAQLMSPGRTRLLVFLGIAVLIVGGCECPRRGPDLSYYRMPADSVGHPGTQLKLPGSSLGGHSRPSKGVAPPSGAVDKIHPEVAAEIAANPGGAARLLISFRDTVSIGLVKGLTGQALIDEMTSLRKTAFDADSANLVVSYNAVVHARYWLIQAMVVEMSLSNVPGLATESRVVRIEPVRSGTAPSPDCGSVGTNTGYTRELIQLSDAYEPFGGGRIALFDTGVFESHVLLAGSPYLNRRMQCGPNGCAPTTTQTDFHTDGHGTSSAAILVGSDAMGADDRGLTQATIDSYAVFDGDPTAPVTNLEAAVMAFQLAVATEPTYDLFLPVIAEPYGGAGALTQLANWANKLGALVLAPNGSSGGADIPAPAVSPRALGVGSYCSLSQQFKSTYNHGETADLRPKPDLTTPTYVYTAANSPTDPQKQHQYTGTSCSTPVAGAAALHLRNWMVSATGNKVEPGAVYALLLAATQSEGAEPEEGAGRLQLPSSGTVYWGILPVTNGERWRIPVQVAGAVDAAVAAVIWWTEDGDDGTGIPVDAYRDDFDLYLLDETGAVRDQASSYTSVFERVETSGVRGTEWTLEVVGYRVLEESKDVFWALWVKD